MLDGTYDAGLVYDFVLRDIEIAGVNALLDGEDAQRLIDLIQIDYAPVEPGEEPEEMPISEKAMLKEMRDSLKKYWPDYRSAQEQMARRRKLLSTLAFATFCVGWENVRDEKGEPLEFVANKLGMVRDDVLKKVPHLMLNSAGNQAYNRQYGRGQVKNSAPPSQSSPDQKTSSSGGKSKKAGKSGQTSGSKTQK